MTNPFPFDAKQALQKTAEFGGSLLCGVALAWVITEFVLFLGHVPSASMYPTVTVDSRILVIRDKTLEPGDLGVFLFKPKNQAFIKRVIGVGGDVVELTETGDVLVNGTRLDEPYLAEPSYYEPQTFEVPEDCYFFLGDNRNNSHDSRFWVTKLLQQI